MKLHLFDTCEQDILEYVETASDFIEEGVNEGGGVLVHCISGMSRSAAMVAAWMMSKREYTFGAALEHLLDRRGIVEPNEGFTAQLTNLSSDTP